MNAVLPGPNTVIAAIHELGEHLGFERVRIDRQVRGPVNRPTSWFEVGYGCQEIKIRFSSPDGGHGQEPYRANWDKVDMDEVARRLTDLIDATEPVFPIKEGTDPDDLF